MHELAITEKILEIAVPKAKEMGAKRIVSINLKLGELSDIVPDCIERYLEYSAKGTIAEGAKVKSSRIPIRILCRECGWEGEVSRKDFKCQACGSLNVKLTQGREYYIDFLEVE